MTARTVRIWYKVHRWTSIISTGFLLMLCITGLPLVFYHDILHWQHADLEPPVMAADTPAASLAAVEEAARARHPNLVVPFISWDEDDRNLLFVGMAKAFDSPPESIKLLAVDARTAKVLGEPNLTEGIMYILRTLHVDMFAGIPGKLFLGVMGLLLLVAIGSGVVLYAPFMRRLDFGTVRQNRGTRIKWLDLHNLLGIVTLAWLTVVGATGVINTWADSIFKLWQFGQLADMIAPYKDLPAPQNPISIDVAHQVAMKAAPEGRIPSFVTYPGTLFSGKHHYGLFLRGEEHVTAKLLTPVLIDAQSGQITDMRRMPWYVDALFVSQPLHFGDYGGLPMKLLWVILDLISIAVLATGLYLFFTRRKTAEEDLGLGRANRKLEAASA
ncbi:PepSY domain-containing protein [Hyphomicrobium sp. CS1GBMeth3]|uniref:PepSY-associated TM helix domain-containing protein n=1 Tax=Hyphomicrobium sp. CS1GBMeth3 TaxID=1892845 RepID=UPI00093058C3|nr:PepSY domain-containing protein [Hyphomicrobium sp. CS1GBMeth3]